MPVMASSEVSGDMGRYDQVSPEVSAMPRRREAADFGGGPIQAGCREIWGDIGRYRQI